MIWSCRTPQPTLVINDVKTGASVLIVDRGRPVARLESAAGDQAGGEAGQLDHLVRAGVVRAGRAPFPKARIATDPPRARKASAVQTLLDERRSGR